MCKKGPEESVVGLGFFSEPAHQPTAKEGGIEHVGQALSFLELF